jgi:hypothetical protein
VDGDSRRRNRPLEHLLNAAAVGDFDEGGRPLGAVAVFLVKFVEIDDDGVTGANDGKPIHVARCAAAAGDVVAVRLKAGMVLRTFELMVAVGPAECRVLVRAREIEGVHRALPAHENDVVLLVDLRSVRGRDRVAHRLAGATRALDELERHRKCGCPGHANGDQRTRHAQKRLSQKAPSARRQLAASAVIRARRWPVV